MFFALLRWLASNVSTLLLAFILSVVVWVSAVVTTDPNEQAIYRPVNIEEINRDTNLVIVGEYQNQVRLSLEAPRTIWTRLNNNPGLVRAWIDLSGLEAGTHEVPVRASINASPVRIIRIEPQAVTVVLEPLESRTLPVQLIVTGDPPVGYRRGPALLNPSEVTVSGPRSLVSQIAQVRATLDIAGIRETRRVNVQVEAVDQNGDPLNLNSIPGARITVVPRSITVTQPVSLEGGYKNVVVKVVTMGTVATGYRLTNISVTPPNVTVFSTNPQLVNELPGFVDTLPVDLTNLNDDVEIRVALNLPSGISLVGEQSVLVQIGVAAIEGSLTVSLPVETLGLSPELAAHISPPTVDVIVAGPLPVLDTLTPASFRAVVDLTGLELGVHQLVPVVDLVPAQVIIQSVIPDNVEVIIDIAPTPTPVSLTQTTPNPLTGDQTAPTASAGP